ncbi:MULTISPECIES: ABC transporter substrate-binding protein [unclassified Neptuniibacter]|uniref:ABC transporter substrate-binding protein n=1 Tax=unclassified Neptuniibacter TaxID=2630693 RepID=UPI0026E20E47|nr:MULTISPECIES: ABC transporter substrate binding protein [unclassified Neptuniibacter]MDO6514466.1 ABC transporter substrate binding protein [Neptuniibacter sp. 2_MG-2023]MDO6594809.1 ABC transporter substrate binding protein [Neptuniibacter sp. 1_MG-2023]
MNHRYTQKPIFHQWFTPLIGFVLSCVFFIPCSNADNLIVLSRQLPSYQDVADTLVSELKSPSKVITARELSLNNYDHKNYQQVIALGANAGDKLFQLVPDNKNLIISFIPRQTYNSLLLKYKNHPRIKKGTVTAVYLDQPYSRQLALAKLITPDAKSIATALGPHSANDLDLLKAATNLHQLELKYETLQETDNPIHKLQPLIKSADIFLSLPDKSVFNRTTAKWILYISFKQHVPLIGFSKKYVEAGALAAVYSSPADLGKQTAELVNNNANKSILPKPAYPHYFHVSTNPTAAKSLHLTIPSEEELTKQLIELEK